MCLLIVWWFSHVCKCYWVQLWRRLHCQKGWILQGVITGFQHMDSNNRLSCSRPFYSSKTEMGIMWVTVRSGYLNAVEFRTECHPQWLELLAGLKSSAGFCAFHQAVDIFIHFLITFMYFIVHNGYAKNACWALGMVGNERHRELWQTWRLRPGFKPNTFGTWVWWFSLFHIGIWF